MRDQPPRSVRVIADVEGMLMFGIIALVLVVAWLLGFFVLHVSSFLIHILLIVAVISIVMHFAKGRSA